MEEGISYLFELVTDMVKSQELDYDTLYKFCDKLNFSSLNSEQLIYFLIDSVEKGRTLSDFIGDIYVL